MEKKMYSKYRQFTKAIHTIIALPTVWSNLHKSLQAFLELCVTCCYQVFFLSSNDSVLELTTQL